MRHGEDGTQGREKGQMYAMRAAFAFLWIGLVIFLITRTADAASDETTVRIGYYQSHLFQEGDGETAMRSGYGYEYIQKVASYTGWRYEYVPGDWDELFQKLKDGEIDLMAGIAWSEERSAQIGYPDYEMLKETFYIYKDSDDTTMRSGDIPSFSGKRIGTVEDPKIIAALDTWVQENQAEIEMVTYPELEDCAEAFNEGLLDGFVSADNIVTNSSYAGITPVEVIGKEPYYLCVAKDHPELLDALNTALAIINGQDSLYLEILKNKYSADTSVSVFLSRQEQEWMGQHPTVTVGYLDHYLPYSDTDADGEVTGLIRDVVPDLFAALPGGYVPEIEWKRFDDQEEMLKELEAGALDFVFPVGGELPYAEENGYQQSSTVMNSAADLVYTGNYGARVTERIAVNQNNQLQYYYTVSNYPDAEIVYCSSIEDCLAKVKKGEADSTIVSALRVVKYAREDSDLQLLPLEKTSSICFGVRFGSSALLRLLNHGLSILGEGYGLNHAYQYIGDLVAYTVGDFIREYQGVLYLFAFLLLVAVMLLGAVRYQRLREMAEKEAEHNRILKQALSREQQASRARQTFLDNMSHDIRTPLNGVLGIIDMNGKCTDQEQIQKNRQKAKTSIYELLDLVNNVIEMSRLESGDREENHAPVDLEELTGLVYRKISQRAAQEGLTFTKERIGEKKSWPIVSGNEDHIREILMHVLENAIKYNKKGGSISWCDGFRQVSQEEAVYECTISDTGIGMTPEFQKRVFEPFAQEKADARTTYRGAGLGLAIVKMLIEQEKGTIELTSEPDAGTTVHIILPFSLLLSNTGERIQRPLQERAEDSQPSDLDLSGRNLLLVDDNELNVEIARFMLEDAGAQVTVAKDGAQAVELYRSGPSGTFSAVLMDLMMPVMDGCEAAKRIRASEKDDAAELPIIATTACVSEEARAASRDAGINAFLEKPLDMQRLIRLILHLSGSER